MIRRHFLALLALMLGVLLAPAGVAQSGAQTADEALRRSPRAVDTAQAFGQDDDVTVLTIPRVGA